MLEKLISLIQNSRRKDIRLTIVVESGSVQIGVEKLSRSKAGKPTWLTATHCGGGVDMGPYRDADVLATEVILELASNAVETAAKPKERQPR